MLLALSVLGGLAVPNNPDAPSYAAGEWHRYTPVQKVHSPKNAAEYVNTNFIPDSRAFLSGDLAELRVEDCRRLYADGTQYTGIISYQVDKAGKRWAQMRTYLIKSSSNYEYGLDYVVSGIAAAVSAKFPVTAPVIITRAESGTAITGAVTAPYSGNLDNTTPAPYVTVRSREWTQDFYYHHAAKGAWRCDLMALQTADGHGAVIDLVAQQFIAIA